jgi:hypothetical protein
LPGANIAEQVTRLEVGVHEQHLGTVDRDLPGDVAAQEGQSLRQVHRGDVGGEGGPDRIPQQSDGARIHQQHIVIHDAHRAALEGRIGAGVLRGDHVAHVLPGQRGLELREEVDLDRTSGEAESAQHRLIHIEIVGFLDAHHIGPVGGDLMGDRPDAGGEVGVLQRLERRPQRGALSLGAEHRHHRVHVRPDVQVARHHADGVLAVAGGVVEGDVGLGGDGVLLAAGGEGREGEKREQTVESAHRILRH